MKKNNTIKTELYHLGELPPAWETDLELESLQADLEELDDSDRAILEKYKPADMARQIRERMEGSPRKESNEIPFKKPAARSRMTFLIPAAAMILFGLLLPTMIPRNNSMEEEQEITRMKGMEVPQLKVYRKLEAESEKLTEDSSVSESDLIQLGYRVSSRLYGHYNIH